MKENKTLEWKEQVTNSFLKTVSAFANFGTGKVLFGIRDNGEVCGIVDTAKSCLDIENKINDSITPKPDFELSVNSKTNVITLKVFEGRYKPYLYKGKAYRRSDTATIAVDQLELMRLTLEGSNIYYEQLEYHTTKDLTFHFFESKVKEILGISGLSEDILRTFGFYTEEGKWNNAAALFADKNHFYGIDCARFGDSINVILDRETFSGCSILEQYDKAVDMFQKYYQYEEIEGISRVQKELIPEEAFREAVANALVHRTWDINSHIRVSMYPDRIEISSPGGLPKGITKEEYLYGNISNLRNPIIGNVFFRLHYIEMFGTGIRRIMESYRGYTKQPVFHITENTITIVLPLQQTDFHVDTQEKMILDVLKGSRILSRKEIEEDLGWSKDITIRVLNRLIEKDYVRAIGKGRGRKYTLR